MNHLSKTQINMFRRCPYQYYCRYVLDMKLPPTSSLFMGKCFDKSINFNYAHKIEKGKDENVSAVKDYFNDTFKAEQEEVYFDPEEKPEELKSKGIKTTAVFHKEVCKKVEPKEVQIDDPITKQKKGDAIAVFRNGKKVAILPETDRLRRALNLSIDEIKENLYNFSDLMGREPTGDEREFWKAVADYKRNQS